MLLCNFDGEDQLSQIIESEKGHFKQINVNQHSVFQKNLYLAEPV